MSRPICGSCGDPQGDDGCGCGAMAAPLRTADVPAVCASSVLCDERCRCTTCEIQALRSALATERACGDRRTEELAQAETRCQEIQVSWDMAEAEADRLRRLIREYLVARRSVAHRDPMWSERLHAAEAALLAEAKS